LCLSIIWSVLGKNTLNVLWSVSSQSRWLKAEINRYREQKKEMHHAESRMVSLAGVQVATSRLSSGQGENDIPSHRPKAPHSQDVHTLQPPYTGLHKRNTPPFVWLLLFLVFALSVSELSQVNTPISIMIDDSPSRFLCRQPR
jgi:hypothetical protein